MSAYQLNHFLSPFFQVTIWQQNNRTRQPGKSSSYFKCCKLWYQCCCYYSSYRLTVL